MRTIYEINKELEESNEQLKQDVLYWQRKSQKLEKRNKEIYNGFMATTQELCDTAKEIERLNKIIDELEEYLNKIIDTSSKCEKITCQYVLQYLQKLKGSDKDE